MEKKTEKEKRTSVILPQAAFPVVFYCNRVGIELISQDVLVHFGCVTENMGTISCFAAIFEIDTFRKEKASWGTYLSEIGGALSAGDFSFRCASSRLSSVPLVNVALWSRVGNSAEVRLYAFSVGDLIETQKKSTSEGVKGQPIALIRCPLEVQKQLMTEFLSRVYEK